jgi:hypothetical protein
MKTVQHGTTETRHVVDETISEETRTRVGDNGDMVEYTYGAYEAECGLTAYGESDYSPMLEEFPEDFGNLSIDCQHCANKVDA